VLPSGTAVCEALVSIPSTEKNKQIKQQQQKQIKKAAFKNE
jgi:hypothetical protein